jgi:hypothetical protein
MTPREKTLAATAYHEAGHAVVGWRLDLCPRLVSIVPGEGYQGRCIGGAVRVNPEAVLSDKQFRRIEKYAIVTLAGREAQRKFAPTSMRRHHTRSDYDQATDVAFLLNGPNEAMRNAHMKLLCLRAKGVVEANWHIIKGVANALMAEKQIDGSRILPIAMAYRDTAKESTQ